MRGLSALIAVIGFACGEREPYRCTSSDQCVGNGMAGVCEPTGFCSFIDPSCPDGRKYEGNAGGGLAGTCIAVDAGIDAAMPDACIDSVAYGRHFGCVLRSGRVYCAGANRNGQIGFGLAGMTNITEWMAVREATTSNPITDATVIGGGSEHMCAARAGGALWCWGRGGNGQIGNNATGDATAAVAVRKETADAPLTNIVEIVGGLEHTCARDGDGGVWCWGGNSRNQIGDNTTMQRNRAVSVLTGAAQLSTRRYTTCARKTNDELWCWGLNNDGQMGDGTNTNKAVPTLVGMGKGIAVGGFAICRINLDGTVSCSGQPWRMRVGNGLPNDTPDVTTPTQVLVAPGGAPLANVVELALGGASCARLADGSVRCWSDNTHGQSGTGMTSPYPKQPRRADGSPLDRVEKLWAGYSHACVRRAGAIECWGRGVNGELADGKQEDRGSAAPLRCP